MSARADARRLIAGRSLRGFVDGWLRALSQMDVPARQAYVMAMVPPEERAAAASITNVPRSLASALAPALAGALLTASSFGWPLLIAGSLKIAYDVALFAGFRHREPGLDE